MYLIQIRYSNFLKTFYFRAFQYSWLFYELPRLEIYKLIQENQVF